MKVWVLQSNIVWDCEDYSISKIFANKDKAQKMFNTIMADEYDTFFDRFDEKDIAIEDEDEITYTIYLKGRYMEYHTNITLREAVLIE